MRGGGGGWYILILIIFPNVCEGKIFGVFSFQENKIISMLFSEDLFAFLRGKRPKSIGISMAFFNNLINLRLQNMISMAKQLKNFENIRANEKKITFAYKFSDPV